MIDLNKVKLIVPTDQEQDGKQAFQIPNKFWLRKNKIKHSFIEMWSNETIAVYEDLERGVYYQLNLQKESSGQVYTSSDVFDLLEIQKKECGLMAMATLVDNGQDDQMLLDKILKHVTEDSNSALCVS